jgi:hypothetical protein
MIIYHHKYVQQKSADDFNSYIIIMVNKYAEAKKFVEETT